MKPFKIFYRNEQNVEDNISFSPSAGKPKLVVEGWRQTGVEIEWAPFQAASMNDLCLAHDRAFVEGVLSGCIKNGFGNTLESVRTSLPFSNGSMVSATLFALRTGEICASPTSGFHHSCYSRADDFCTFNGLVIASIKARLCSQKRDFKVGILDMDQHYGNGTDDIIEHLKIDYIHHWSLGRDSGSKINSRNFLFKELPQILEEQFSDVDVLIYQAGADPWVKDPLGGRFTKEELQARDRLVFEFCRRKQIGCAFNLAGGYSKNIQDLLDIHTNTFIEAAIANESADTTVRRLCRVNERS